jgi:prepilin-type N-terminal cleavage/methylation domain-containing protein
MGKQWTGEKGFTLIELSIVLVIIGLLIGGILVGQDLIKAAEVRAQISQIEQYNTAVNTFRGKYGAIPGDMNIATADQFGFPVGAGCTGITGQRDGNGLIDGGSGSAGNNPDLQFIGEVELFWQDLTTPGITSLIPGSFPNSGATASCNVLTESSLPATQIGQYLPAGKIGRGTYVMVGEVNGLNYYILQGVTGVASTGRILSIWATAPIPVLEAYKIDQKMDDGLPTSGNVQAQYVSTTLGGFIAAPSAATDNSSTCYNSTTTNYSLTYNSGAGANCALTFQFQ